MDIIGVIGLGQMGSGIARVAAEQGYKVVIYNHNPDKVEKTLVKLQNSWQKSAEKGKITLEKMHHNLDLVVPASNLDEFRECDLVIESIVEDKIQKIGLLQALDKICMDKTILVSNTSSISITELGSATKRPDRVAGMHFFNPVSAMKLVEIVKGNDTSDETMANIKEAAIKLNKIPVETSDSPGFIVNRLVIQLCNEAVKAVEAGVAAPQEIDTAMKLGMNWPMGPFELIDMAGLDIHIKAAENLAAGLNDNHYTSPELLCRMTKAGHLGKKSGEGFYKYNG
jgi:3-hydroxyacyl-CoA dehydrogenase